MSTITELQQTSAYKIYVALWLTDLNLLVRAEQFVGSNKNAT